MRILDKYILKEFIGPFLFGVCAFTAVFIGTGTLYRIANLINQYGASPWAAFRVFVLAIPSIIVITFPMSVLLGSLMAFGRLSSSSEMIVMRPRSKLHPPGHAGLRRRLVYFAQCDGL
mgnify:CR=1 FL=1